MSHEDRGGDSSLYQVMVIFFLVVVVVVDYHGINFLDPLNEGGHTSF